VCFISVKVRKEKAVEQADDRTQPIKGVVCDKSQKGSYERFNVTRERLAMRVFLQRVRLRLWADGNEIFLTADGVLL
jgi:hypothetical protein